MTKTPDRMAGIFNFWEAKSPTWNVFSDFTTLILLFVYEKLAGKDLIWEGGGRD